MGKFTRVSMVNNADAAKYMDELLFHVAREELTLNPDDKIMGKTILHILNTEAS